jgi:uncharacterized protein YbgA (DUF1722 family)/uncharacterized protein YbbK (DUF523 family)
VRVSAKLKKRQNVFSSSLLSHCGEVTAPAEQQMVIKDGSIDQAMERLKPAWPLYANDEPVKIGVSACLLGAKVRYDAGHKRNDFLADMLGRFVEFVPVCPEVEMGLGVPRETVDLVRDQDRTGVVRLVGNETGVDYSDRMNFYAQQRLTELGRTKLCGYVLKKDSPSCGMERVRVYGPSGMPTRDGSGLFAAALMRRFPNLPIEEEGRLSTPNLRENFVERLFAYRHLSSFFARWTPDGLVQFHTAYKLVLMAHSPKAYNELGRFVANAKRMARNRVAEHYQSAFMEALRKPATTKSHINVMQHMLGYFRTLLDTDSRDELVSLIEDYRRGLVPLTVPITMFRHYVRRFDIGYLRGQIYLEPHPKELMLRNHV